MSGKTIGAVVMAAGLSRRMGQPKLIMPWGETTVIGKVVSALSKGGAQEIVVVTGAYRELVEDALQGTQARILFNPEFEHSEMLSSLQLGLRGLSADMESALVGLGDQPQIETEIVQSVVHLFRTTGSRLVVPSYNMRRGHPWLVERSLWPEILELSGEQTLRDFLQKQAQEIEYLVVDTPSNLMDLDTPEDYRQQRPGRE
jgi:molybdenum cofactor cytidylyltransferase